MEKWKFLTERTTNPCIDTMQAIKKALDITEGESLGNSIVLREEKKIALCLQPIERGDERAFNCARRKCRTRSERKAKSGVI